jgi:UDP-N-acetylglucosamine 1-carboxyvinyltransferase
MDRISIKGGGALSGVIPISGAKNAALPLMTAALLTDGTVTLDNVPRLSDVNQLLRILSNHGVDHRISGKLAGQSSETGQTIDLSARQVVDTTAPYELVSRMRASFWVIGPLLGRMGEARVSLPGGCAIGTRPVDWYLQALERLGVQIEIDGGYVVAKAPKGGMKGAEIFFPKVSVGATHTALMAAVLADGKTVIHNAAREPEVKDVADLLVKMGAKITGAGTSTIEITGVSRLHGARHQVLPDRIETGTYAMAVAMAGGDVLLENARVDLLKAAFDTLTRSGAVVEQGGNGIRIKRNGSGIAPVDVTTEPFPGFPTDLQAQFMALMCRAEGTSHIRETIFENRFMHVQELARLGAKIKLDGDMAIVEGVKHLTGAQVMATDLRASVAMVIAGLVADGETVVHRVYHLDRGFEALEMKLGRCGANIERITG